MKKDSIATSIYHRLLVVAQKTGANVADLTRDFLIERLATRFFRKPDIQHNLVAKGGFVSKRFYGSERLTKDLDLTTNGTDIEPIIAQLIDKAKQQTNDGTTFNFKERSPLVGVEGTRLTFEAQIGAALSTKPSLFIPVDVVSVLSPMVQLLETKGILNQETIPIKVCAPEVTVSEKLLCLVTRADENTRSKDIWDLFKLSQSASQRSCD